jgi:fatty acid amide hydrolase
MTADGGVTALSWIDRDPIDPTLAMMRALARIPSSARRAAARLAQVAGQPKLGRFLSAVGERSVAELWALTATLRSARVNMLARMQEAGVDVILCPPYATPALPHGLSRDFVLAGSPAMLWNAIPFPAGVVPVTRVRADEASRPSAKDALEKRAAEVDRQSAGLPVGVQVVARPWEDDKVLAAMIAIEEAAVKTPDYPRTPVIDIR